MLQISHISQKSRQTIHEKSLHILENTGVAFDYEPALRLLKKHGATPHRDTAYTVSHRRRACYVSTGKNLESH